MNKFYVYEWFIIDTLEVFYVGKGTGKRRFETHNRSKYFKSILNKYNCAVRIYKSYITNEEACEIEIERIAYMKMLGWAKCNFTNGGNGFSTGNMNPRFLNPPLGEKNPMFGVRMTGEDNHFFGKKHTEESRNKISKSRKGKGGRFGKDNPMYGKGFKGEKNPMYGKKGFNHPNSKMYKVNYPDGEFEYLTYKQCEKKFGIAFTRIYKNGGILHYKNMSKNKKLYEGLIIERLK